MTHEDRWRLDDGLEVRHDRGNREALDGRLIAVERFGLDLEPRIRWSENAVASGFIACDPVLPAPRRHPEAMNQYDLRLRGHGASPCGSVPGLGVVRGTVAIDQRCPHRWPGQWYGRPCPADARVARSRRPRIQAAIRAAYSRCSILVIPMADIPSPLTGLSIENSPIRPRRFDVAVAPSGVAIRDRGPAALPVRDP
jgi:hypothetical protein